MGSQTRPSVVTMQAREVYVSDGVYLVRTCPRACVCGWCVREREERARWASARRLIEEAFGEE